MGGIWNLQQAGRSLGQFGSVAVGTAVAEVALIVFSIWGVLQFRDAADDRFDYANTVRDIDGVLIDLLNAETGQRGFVLTEDDSYLAPYRTGVAQLSNSLDALGERMDDAGPQRDAYRSARDGIINKLAEMEASVQLTTTGDAAAAIALIRRNNGLELMHGIRADIQEARDIEYSRLEGANDRVERYGVLVGVTAIALTSVTLAVVVWLFISVRRQRETGALRELARAKDEFVGFVSHELRTPISIISGNARLLTGEDGEPVSADEQRVAAREIVEAGERLQSIVATLLSLAKAESGAVLETEPVLVHRIVSNVARLHNVRFPRRRLELDIADDLPPALGDKDAIEQVLANLLSNAEKYGDRQGGIAISVGADGDDFIRVCVTNDGPVLDQAEFNQVFEPFFRLRSTAAREGIGLGLTICHRLIVAQGGRMSARTRREGGAEFQFSLPTARVDDFD